MNAIRILLFGFSLLCGLPAWCVVPCKPNYTPEQTKTEIARLTTGNNQQIRNTYSKGVLFSTEWQQDWPAHYMQYYYPNGKLKAEGLMISYRNVGTWHYYNMEGMLIKTADYNTMTMKLSPGYSEPQSKILIRMAEKADSFMIVHFGQQFIDSNHVVCDHKYYSTDSTQEAEWMDIPFGKAYKFTFSYSMLIHDSLEFDLLYFSIDASGNFSAALWNLPPCTESNNACVFNVHYDEAMQIAKQYPFTEGRYPRLSAEKSGYHWVFFGPSQGTPNEYSYKVLSIDAVTAQADTFTETSWCDHCEPTVYKKNYKDSMAIAPGYKVICGEGIYLNVPESWIELEEYGKTGNYSDTYTWYGDGDTLHLYTTSGVEPKKMELREATLWIMDYEMIPPVHYKLSVKRECPDLKYAQDETQRQKWIARQRETDSLYAIDSARVVHLNDSLDLAYEAAVARNKFVEDSLAEVGRQTQMRALKKQHLEDSLSRAFVNSFPDSSMQGRAVHLDVDSPGDEQKFWSIEMEVNNDHGGYGVYQTNYHFTADHLTEEQFYRMYAILKTGRFLSYR